MSKCIEHTGWKYPNGYGGVGGARTTSNIRFGKSIRYAHILAWIDANARLPEDGREIGHSCHNRACINPDHLYECTHAENMRDMSLAGRTYNQKQDRFGCGCEKTPENTIWMNGGTRRRCHKHYLEKERQRNKRRALSK